MKFYRHPSTHGHHVNPWTCGDRLHRHCSGFSGGYDTYLCGCCCHDEERGLPLSDEDRQHIRRLREGVPL